MVAAAAEEEEEDVVVGSTATTTIRATGSRLLTTSTSSHGHPRLKQALTAKQTPTHPVSIIPREQGPSSGPHSDDASNH